MWISNEKKERKLYKRALRILGWPSPRKIWDLWRITRFRIWTWHQSSLFSSIQLHPCKKIRWSCRNMSSLHKNTNENISLEGNSTWYLYKMIGNHSAWMEEAFPTKIPWLVDLVPNTRNVSLWWRNSGIVLGKGFGIFQLVILWPCTSGVDWL